MIDLKKIVIFSLIIFIIDQVFKLLIGFGVDLNTSFVVIKDFFNISNVHNYGAAFSILYGNRIFLVLVSLFALFFIYYFLIKNKELSKIDICIYSLLIGGILGNLFDRIVFGYVVDFFDFKIFGYNFPVFNIADICIVFSVFLLLFDSIRGYINDYKSRR